MPNKPPKFKIGQTMKCPVCNKEFVKEIPAQKYCSKECQYRMQIDKARKLYDKPTLICAYCGKSFKRKCGNQKYCSPECNRLMKENGNKPKPIKNVMSKSLKQVTTMMTIMGYGSNYGKFCREHPELL